MAQTSFIKPFLVAVFLHMPLASAGPLQVEVSRRGAQPKYPVDSGVVSPCSLYLDYDASTGLSCDIVTLAYGVTAQELVLWNPSLVLNGSSCTNFQDRHSYCVQVPAAQPPSSPSPSPTPALTTTTTAQPHTTTTPSNGVATPTPTQPGISSSCDQFYFVQTGDTCDAIAQKYGTTAAAIESMNPGVGSDCTAMQASVYLCIALIDQPDKTTNNIQTPSPVQPGMVRDCDNFAYVSQGQTCAEVASANGISTQQFEAWNTGAGSGCASMWADVYACVGVTS